MPRTTRLLPGHLGRRAGLALVVTAAIGGALAAPAAAATPVSTATAQAVNVGLLGALNVAASPSGTTSTNDGTGSNAATTNAPAVGLLSGQTFLGAGALQETTQAGTDGSSYGCSGVLSPNSTIQVGSAGSTCTVNGNGTGGVTVNLKAVPTLGTALAPYGQFDLTIDSVVGHAKDVNGTITRAGSVAGVKLTTCLLVCITPTVVSVPVPSGANENLLTAVVAALTAQGGLSTLVDLLSNSIAPLVSLISNYQPSIAGGVGTVSGLHIGLIGGTAASADLARVTVGPNATAAPTPAVTQQGLPIALAVLAVLAIAAVLIRRSRLTGPTQV